MWAEAYLCRSLLSVSFLLFALPQRGMNRWRSKIQEVRKLDAIPVHHAMCSKSSIDSETIRY